MFFWINSLSLKLNDLCKMNKIFYPFSFSSRNERFINWCKMLPCQCLENWSTYNKYKAFIFLYRKIKNSLQQFIKSEKSSANPTWICSLPLYHFLLGKLRPYEEMNKKADHNAKKPLWWGKDDFEIEMDYLKGKSKWSMFVYLILVAMETW